MNTTAEIIVLAMLAAAPKHGYQIMKDVEQLTGQSVTVGGSRLYPLLRTLEQRGAISHELAPSPTVGAPSRHIYSLTAQGKALLEEYLCDLHLAETEEGFLLAVALFPLVPTQQWSLMLHRRLEVLEAERQRLGRIVEQYDTPVTEWPKRVTAFRARQVAGEQQWIQDLLREHVPATAESRMRGGQ